MNNDQLDDLKQFILVTVSQSETRLTERIDKLENRVGSVEGRMDSLEQKMDDGFAGIGDAIQQVLDKLDKHEERIIALEQRAA